mmetsp:Transcript_14279/g.23634  ORF Transcript_14279/g.23634 Transcript_14279/m.23634 type:complete len:245 (+) Transcript_14279:677-1411(+)
MSARALVPSRPNPMYCKETLVMVPLHASASAKLMIPSSPASLQPTRSSVSMLLYPSASASTAIPLEVIVLFSTFSEVSEWFTIRASARADKPALPRRFLLRERRRRLLLSRSSEAHAAAPALRTRLLSSMRSDSTTLSCRASATAAAPWSSASVFVMLRQHNTTRHIIHQNSALYNEILRIRAHGNDSAVHAAGGLTPGALWTGVVPGLRPRPARLQPVAGCGAGPATAQCRSLVGPAPVPSLA